MRRVQDRTVLTVNRHEGLWRVECDGENFGHSADRDVANAAAHRRAREMQDAGRACQVQVFGEWGFGRDR